MMRIATNDVTLEVAVAGDASEPAVLLLHGWPDTHALWRHQVGALVECRPRVGARGVPARSGRQPRRCVGRPPHSVP
jgi:pimeloyl-ACP methyl ester carboxylesterase